MNLNLKQQITLLISLALIVPAILIGTVSIYSIQKKASVDIQQYRTGEYDKLKESLKHITDIAYGIIEAQHDFAVDTPSKSDSLMEVALTQLSKLRFDQGQGYFWVTDNKLPYPTMLMHAEKSNLKGQVLSDAKHNVEKEHGRNIYQVRAELANANGDAFVEYIMKKPGTDEVDNKISYSRLYKPLGWIISTGFYTDQIEKNVVARKQELSSQITSIILFIIIIGLTVLIAGMSISFYFSKKLTSTLVDIKEKLRELAQGRQVDRVISSRKDEVGEMASSLNLLVDGLKAYTSFAKEVGKGKLDQDFQPLSEQDILGTELIVMRDNLKAAESEKSLRDWTNEGMARMGEVLRRNNTNTKDLAEEVLRELVKYMKVNQGALFVVANNSKEVLELMATYAYEKKKFVNDEINIGNGLAGQCVLERKTVYLKEVPKDYVRITSGLGEALPRTLILVPLIHNEKVYGVLEMASFKPLDTYHITFIEKVAESIASTISTVQGNEQTKTLLEQSRQMSEMMKSQEEEMRQNMEELSATQEQMARQIMDSKKAQDNLSIHEKVFGLTTMLSESDLNGNILLVNDKFGEVSKYHTSELIGNSHRIIRHVDMPKRLFDLLWEKITSGRVFKGILKNKTKDQQHYWVDITIMPVKDDHGKTTKYIATAYHLMDEVLAIEMYNKQARQLNLPLLSVQNNSEIDTQSI
jgi:PAS domain S-box-containing protein